VMQVRELTTTYQGLVAISEVSIDVASGEIVCVVEQRGRQVDAAEVDRRPRACAIWHDYLLRREDRGPRRAPHHGGGCLRS